jgi:hypothetical protein
MSHRRTPHIYSVHAWRTPAGGASDTRRVELLGYAKLNSSGGPVCVVNEYVCGRLGELIGLPVPPGALVEGPPGAGPAWVTLSFSDVPLPPVDPAEVSRLVPGLATEVVVFDVLIANEDRHAGNLAFFSADRRLEVFDHSHALLGAGAGAGIGRLDRLRDALVVDGTGGGNRHCLLDRLTDAMAVKRAIDITQREVRDLAVRRVCADAEKLGIGLAKGEGAMLADRIVSRRERLDVIIRGSLTQFRAIPVADWGLI